MAKKTEFAPMLAAKTPADGFKYRFPVLVSPKLDGIRAIIRDGKVYSRSLKLIPNLHVQKLFGRPALNGLDGELIVGETTDRDENGDDVMQRTTKGVMRIEGEPNVTFWVFDHAGLPNDNVNTFENRLHCASLQVGNAARAGLSVEMVEHYRVSDQDQLDMFEADCLKRKFEGAMVRDPNGAYKFGRSTAKEGGLIKLKRFEDREALVVGMTERMHNANEAEEDELGHTKRSTHQDNLVGLGDLGALVCQTPAGVEFNIGTGFTLPQRVEYYVPETIGKLVKYKSFTAAGVKVAPRFPVFVAFRDEIDL